MKHHAFGETRRWMYSIEWQKRGLPHAHILIWMMEKITPNRIDEIISAEIPDTEIDKELHNIISKNMIHGPCCSLNNRSPYMSDGKCTKWYPRDFLAESITGNDDIHSIDDDLQKMVENPFNSKYSTILLLLINVG